MKITKCLTVVGILSSILFTGCSSLAARPAKKTNDGPGDEACDISETLSCTAVDETEYSEIFGIALSIYGIAGYTLLITLSFICLSRKRKNLDVFSFLLYGGCWAGFIFSAYLTWLETFVIKAFCPYCVVSAVAMTIILVCVLVAYGFSPLGIFAPKKRRG